MNHTLLVFLPTEGPELFLQSFALAFEIAKVSKEGYYMGAEVNKKRGMCGTFS